MINDNEKIRQSNFELLRIVSMILIILAHCVYYGCSFVEQNELNMIVLKSLRGGAKIGVNCFILITGYFMINKKIEGKKIIKLELNILFYTLFALIINLIFKFESINIVLLLKSFLPIIFEMYWFMTSYFVVYLLSPYINVFFKGMDKKMQIQLLMLLTIILSIIPTVTTSNFIFSNFLWFSYLYMIGAFISVNKNDNFFEKYFRRNMLIISILFIVCSIIGITIVSSKFNGFEKYINYFTGMNKIPILAISISMFCIFKNMKIRNSIINKISSSMFGIYLLHENVIIRKILWQKQSELVGNSNLYIIYIFLSVMIVFVFGLTFDKLIQPIINIVSKYILSLYDRILEIIRNSGLVKKRGEN